MREHGIQPVALLRSLGQKYQHLKQEHGHTSPESGPRRRLGNEMEAIASHFERLLAEWVPDDPLRTRWRDFMQGRETAPDEPRFPPASVFKGITEAGSVVDVRPSADGYDVFVDGARVDHGVAAWSLDREMTGSIHVAGRRYEERFDASDQAVLALEQFVLGRGDPPWAWARELVEDGLVDTELALTARGKRRLRRLRRS